MDGTRPDRSFRDDYWGRLTLPAESKRQAGDVHGNAIPDVVERCLPQRPALSAAEIGGAPGRSRPSRMTPKGTPSINLRRQLAVRRPWQPLLVASVLLAGGAAFLVSGLVPRADAIARGENRGWCVLVALRNPA